MKRTLQSGVVFFCLIMAGCAGTSLRVQSAYQPLPGEKIVYDIKNNVEVSEEAFRIMRARLNGQLQVNGLLAAWIEESDKLVEITITNYYMRNDATRLLIGIMAGVDKITSTIRVKNRKTKTVLAEFVVHSKNPSAWGSSRGMIEEHVDRIVQYLKSGQS